MVTVFDLVTGETQRLSSKPAPARKDSASAADAPRVLPRLQEHTFTEPARTRDLPLELAQLDCEVFLRAMEQR